MDSMTVTFSLHDLLQIVLTGSVVFAAVYFAIVLRRLAALLGQWQRTSQRLDELIPKLGGTVAKAEETLASADAFLKEGTSVVKDLSAVSRSVKNVTEEALGQVSLILGPLRNVAALVLGIQHALSVLLGRKGIPSEESEKEEEHEERDK